MALHEKHHQTSLSLGEVSNGVSKEYHKGSMNGFGFEGDDRKSSEFQTGTEEEILRRFQDNWKCSNEEFKNFFKRFEDFISQQQNEETDLENSEVATLKQNFEVVKKLIRSHTSEIQIISDIGSNLIRTTKDVKSQLEEQKQEMMVKIRVLEGRCEDLSSSVARMKTDNQQQQNQISHLHKSLKEGQDQESFSKNKIRRLCEHLEKTQKKLTEEALAYKIEADDNKFELNKSKEIIENYKAERNRFVRQYHASVCCLQQLWILSSIDVDSLQNEVAALKVLNQRRPVGSQVRVQEFEDKSGCGCFGFVVKKKTKEAKPNYQVLKETE